MNVNNNNKHTYLVSTIEVFIVHLLTLVFLIIIIMIVIIPELFVVVSDQQGHH